MAKKSVSPLGRVKEHLQKLARKPFKGLYRVPGLWSPVGTEATDGQPPAEVHPAKYYLSHLEAIDAAADRSVDPLKSLNGQKEGGKHGSWIANGSIYNVFVRLTTAFDHDGDSRLGTGGQDPTLNADGMRETGTFLKTIALLGHIRRLGCTTVHLLPVTAIGHDGNKGVLGSPYAIKDPYRLEASQADPLLDMPVDDQFRALVEACHLLGMRVIVEFVFRTASKDSDWTIEHPDWFYWIDEKVADRQVGETDLEVARRHYGNPIFTPEELKVINDKVSRNDFHDLPAPPETFRRFFQAPPAKGKVKVDAHGRVRGTSVDPATGKTLSVRIPGAFADWPPDDNQPPWGDVTYLRMYRDENPAAPRFNYIAYNTIRMYDAALARPELANRPLWDKIRDLAPYYQDQFGIDGVMVDMGHAVPVSLMQEIIAAARAKDPDFCFLSENFAIEQSSVDAGYNAVVGYAWWVEYKREGMMGLLDHVGVRGVPLPFFGAVENHNTPRAAGRPGGERYATYAFLVNTFLPRSIPFIHAGFELGETMPVNTGLDFSNADLEKFRGKALPLFDPGALRWEGAHPMLGITRCILDLRARYRDTVDRTGPGCCVPLSTGNPDVMAFLRTGGSHTLMVLFNRNLELELGCTIDLKAHLPPGTAKLANLLDKAGAVRDLPVRDGVLSCAVRPGDSLFFAW
ncbi:MAG: alpha-amylase [Candidatus Riflebacteria bacterium]|nr:alpha-amylase [Candidatus Riflebacteria bacterium]